MNLLASRERQAGSVLLLPELVGVLTRLAGSDRAMANRVVRKLRDDMSVFELVPADIAQAELAARIAGERRIRGSDALHLASACIIAHDFRRGFRFITSDLEQAAAARSEKLRVIFVN